MEEVEERERREGFCNLGPGQIIEVMLQGVWFCKYVSYSGTHKNSEFNLKGSTPSLLSTQTQVAINNYLMDLFQGIFFKSFESHSLRPLLKNE